LGNVKKDSAEVESLLGNLASSTSERIRAGALDAERTLTGLSSTIGGTIKQDAAEIEHTLNTLASSTSEAIRGSAHDAERTLTSLSSGVTTVLKQNASEVERTLLGVGAEVVRTFTAKADEMTTAVGNKAGEITRLLDDKSSNLLSAIENKGRTLVSEVSRITDATVSAIESRGVATARVLVSNSEEISRLINDSTNNASATLTRQMRDLQEQTRSAVDQSQRTSSAAVSEMHETHNMLRTDVNALFERLREANTLLQDVLGGATENLASIEGSLSTRVAEFVVAMNDVGERSNSAGIQVDEHIKSFQAMSGNVLREITALAEQFDVHGRALAAAATLVDKSNTEIKTTLGGSRESVEGLVRDLTERTGELSTAINTKTEELSKAINAKTDELSAALSGNTERLHEVLGTRTEAVMTEFGARTDALEQRLKRFGVLLTESFETSDARARDIARVIAEATTEGARAITGQYELVRSTSEEESRRTSEALRGIYEQATGDTSSLFKQTAEQFAEIVRDLKSMTGEMQRELEGTREQLRKGILELPQETADSAAQMRRVIVDQIEALAELNRIVARHGRGIDAADNTRRTVREEAVAASASGRGSVVRPIAPESRAPAPAPRQSEPRPAPAPAQTGDGRSGWLSDLLTRASREEEAPPAREERPARHTIESLDSISVDIARMIDHDAATELWDRYKRGERNVFTRRLYTIQGQQTFDEIRKRYRADREFRQTVDRYIGEFERLLEEVSRDDRGQVVARTYLTSETGKVYTMLAHAAGRFD
jgi:hypothetical protein